MLLKLCRANRPLSTIPDSRSGSVVIMQSAICTADDTVAGPFQDKTLSDTLRIDLLL